ncbi:hypothetical protein ACJX0J_026215 [Zea mays]
MDFCFRNFNELLNWKVKGAYTGSEIWHQFQQNYSIDLFPVLSWVPVLVILTIRNVFSTCYMNGPLVLSLNISGVSGSLEEKVEYDRAVYEEALNDVPNTATDKSESWFIMEVQGLEILMSWQHMIT